MAHLKFAIPFGHIVPSLFHFSMSQWQMKSNRENIFRQSKLKSGPNNPTLRYVLYFCRRNKE